MNVATSAVINFLFNWTHSYGLAIILLTIGIRIVIMPVYQRQMVSMRRMQEIQPKIKALQQKYKDDKQRLGQAQMDLYKEYKINPLSGCLPMLIQIPLLWAIYDTLIKFHYVGSSSFLWVPSLSANSLAGGNLALGLILPVLAAATTFWQTRISTPSLGDKSQQMLTTVMIPLFVGYMSARFPAGLALYWVVSNLFAVAQQYLMVGTTTSGAGGAAPRPQGATRK